MTDDDTRPAPDALLDEARKEGRGSLKVFLGPYPGVGKTYAMLTAAQERRREGRDVVIGIVETHGRKETERLMRGLEQIPRRRQSYRGQSFGEMDLGAILERRPSLCLVDELAHTNIPGSRHAKRWQDVEELRDAGIDVYTTLNVQHLESLNDIVARISGVRVRETLPDQVLSEADEIELIDLPPDDLIQRLREGKVYMREQIGRALHNFFSKGNLTAFRELALRAAADRVDAQMLGYMKSHAVAGPWPAGDRVLVCVNEARFAKPLVRAAKRQAERLRAPWIALHVRGPHYDSLPSDAREAVGEAMRLAESLGADAATIDAESKVADAILAFARERNVSRIVVGRPRPRKITGLMREGVSDTLLRKGRNFEFSLIADPDSAPAPAIGWSPGPPPKRLEAYVFALLASAAATLAAFALFGVLPLANLSLVYLMAVLATAVRHGTWASLFAAVVSAFSYNFFFTEPYRTFSILAREDILTVLFFAATSIAVGNLAGWAKNRAAAATRAARTSEQLYEVSRSLSRAATLEEIAGIAADGVSRTAGTSAVVFASGDATSQKLASAGEGGTLSLTDMSAIEWALRSGKPAGWSSDTLPSSNWLALPLAGPDGRVHAVLAVHCDAASPAFEPDRRRLIDAIANQAAAAMERTRLSADIEEARVLSETEKLRSALLSSVSHDLRTPLVSIIGSATTLDLYAEGLEEADRKTLTAGILREAERLNRFVQNLLDMTRIGYGALRVRRQWSDLREILGHAVREIRRTTPDARIGVDLGDLGPVFVDPVLMEQVFTNLLDNAVKHGGDGEIRVTGAAEAGEIVLAVTDQGRGIPKAEREAVFDMFHRVQDEDRRSPGTGLGLAICRGLIEAHGGTIRAVDPDAERGARFEIRLPLTAMPNDPGAEEKA